MNNKKCKRFMHGNFSFKGVYVRDLTLPDVQKPAVDYGGFTTCKMLLCMYFQVLLGYDTIKLPPFP